MPQHRLKKLVSKRVANVKYANKNLYLVCKKIK